MSCMEESRRTPNGLRVKVEVQSDAGRCRVRAGTPGTHRLEITNRSFRRFTVAPRFECDTSCVRFMVNGQRCRSHAPEPVSVGARPGRGAFRAAVLVDLASCGDARDQIVRTEVSWTPVGWSTTVQDTLYVRVETS